MRKAILIGFLMAVTLNIYAGTEYKDACRQVVYAVKPIDVVAGLDDSRSTLLTNFSQQATLRRYIPL
ncbi:MAG: hypothetical protein LBK62_05665 [Treponema sp.]|jgi:hypothetical protein|nr:hypothetical protein [Treponema sp.]